MTGEDRRKQIVDILSKSTKPVNGTTLANTFNVSRQVIVQDIALLRANGEEIFSANRGYMIKKDTAVSRVFKVIHSDEEIADEMNLIVDCGGIIQDVFVYHKYFGVIKADMNIKSRIDVEKYTEDIMSGKSKPLKNITSGYHYHTITADTNDILETIEEKLKQRGYYAKLQDYEPVDFWAK